MSCLLGRNRPARVTSSTAPAGCRTGNAQLKPARLFRRAGGRVESKARGRLATGDSGASRRDGRAPLLAAKGARPPDILLLRADRDRRARVDRGRSRSRRGARASGRRDPHLELQGRRAHRRKHSEPRRKGLRDTSCLAPRSRLHDVRPEHIARVRRRRARGPSAGAVCEPAGDSALQQDGNVAELVPFRHASRGEQGEDQRPAARRPRRSERQRLQHGATRWSARRLRLRSGDARTRPHPHGSRCRRALLPEQRPTGRLRRVLHDRKDQQPARKRARALRTHILGRARGTQRRRCHQQRLPHEPDRLRGAADDSHVGFHLFAGVKRSDIVHHTRRRKRLRLRAVQPDVDGDAEHDAARQAGRNRHRRARPPGREPGRHRNIPSRGCARDAAGRVDLESRGRERAQGLHRRSVPTGHEQHDRMPRRLGSRHRRNHHPDARRIADGKDLRRCAEELEPGIR